MSLVVEQRFGVVGNGAYNIQGREYPYTVLSTGEGDPFTFSIGQDVPVEARVLPVFQWVKARVEFRQDGKKLKGRLLGWEPDGGKG